MSWGFFITFEGIEGSGKSSVSDFLYKYLSEIGFEVIRVREPGGTFVGEKVREILLNPEIKLSPWTEVFLFLASRKELTEKIILPALKKGKIVISDRYYDSTIAYQCFGRGLPYRKVIRMIKIATNELKPNLTFLLDIPPEVGLKRASKNSKPDRFEREKIEFHKKVREGFLKIAKRAPGRIKIIDATKSFEEVCAEVKEITIKKLIDKGIKKFLRR